MRTGVAVAVALLCGCGSNGTESEADAGAVSDGQGTMDRTDAVAVSDGQGTTDQTDAFAVSDGPAPTDSADSMDAPSDAGDDAPCTTQHPHTLWPPACGTAVCGNGVRDSCNQTCTGINCPAPSTEVCDGPDLGGATCASIGYSSGSLTCDTSCFFDQRACVACAVPTGPLLACQALCVEQSAPQAASLAATDTTIALAWQSTDSASAFFYFALFDQNLNLLAQMAPLAKVNRTNVVGVVTLAPSSNGWLLAIWDADLTITAFDSTARPVGTPHVVPGAFNPKFGVRPGGSPLLTWGEAGDGSGVLRGAVIADDGSFASAPADLLDGPIEAPDVLFVGDGYLLAARNGLSITTTRVGLDGSPSGKVQQPVGTYSEYPALAAVGSDFLMVYDNWSSSNSGMKVATIDSTGALVSGPNALSPQPTSYALPSLVSTGTDALLFYVSGTPAPAFVASLRVSHLDASGSTTVAPYVVASYADIYGTGQNPSTMVRQGDHAVIAFGDEHSLDLAKVSLTAH